MAVAPARAEITVRPTLSVTSTLPVVSTDEGHSIFVMLRNDIFSKCPQFIL